MMLFLMTAAEVSPRETISLDEASFLFYRQNLELSLPKCKCWALTVPAFGPDDFS